MTPIILSDDMLGAFIDGELSAEQQVEIQRLLDHDPGARVRLERFRRADRLVREAWALPAQTHTDTATSSPMPSPPSTPRLRHGTGTTAASAPWARPWAMALAAGVVGVAVGVNWPQRPTGRDAGVENAVLGRALTATLDTLPSGRTRGTTQVALTFRTPDGTPCRQFRVAGRSGAAEAIACRAGSGWRLVAWDATATSPDGGYRTAGAATAIDAMADRLDASGALAPAQEAALIRRGWR